MIIAPFFYLFSLFLLPARPVKTNAPLVVREKHVNLQPVSPNTKFIYLTFDDGPLLGTSNCLDICTQQNVEATFFEVGMHQARSKYGKDLYDKILQRPDLFEIENHSYTHAMGKYLDFYHHPSSALLDFIKAKQTLQLNNNIVRLPGNNAWNILNFKRASGLVKPVVQKLDSAGFNVIGWDVEWGFNKQGKPLEAAETMARMVDSTFARNKTVTKNHLVILMHDHMYRSSADSVKLATMVALLKTNPNYAFRRISQYPGLKMPLR